MQSLLQTDMQCDRIACPYGSGKMCQRRAAETLAHTKNNKKSAIYSARQTRQEEERVCAKREREREEEKITTLALPASVAIQVSWSSFS